MSPEEGDDPRRREYPDAAKWLQQSQTSHPYATSFRSESMPNFANTKRESCVLLAATCAPIAITSRKHFAH
ncbi:hypothetical protein STEG23_029703, partial [Scotinomys teguina]